MDSAQAHTSTERQLPGLDGKVALVTGAGRGIGAGAATALAAAGTSVGVVDVDATTAEATAESIRAAGGRATSRAADVTREDEIRRAAEEIAAELGPIGIVVAAAAIDEAVPAHELTLEQWQRMIEVNLTGVFLTVKTVLPEMRRRREGRIVLFGSSLTDKGGIDLSHYCAAKGGVQAWARSLARELVRDGINVNVVSPGPVDTEMLRSLPAEWLETRLEEMPMRRWATIAEIVPTVLLLASDAGAYYVGATMNVSGGDAIP
jgi:3-oxoacyl-[acyl-carrier protein] reductase